MTTQEVTTDINSLELQPIPIASQDNETHCLDVIRKQEVLPVTLLSMKLFPFFVAIAK